jgi:anti-sigma regulatory factor (Ser/Thr protein kinase)
LQAGVLVRRERGEEVAYLELAALPSAPFWARRQIKNVLRAWQLWPDTVDVAELLVSELITNAVKSSGHVAGPQAHTDLERIERVSMTLRLLPGRVIIEVSDNNQDPPVLGNADADAENGRGLMLVQALSKEWGYFLPPSGGKTVFSVLETPDISERSRGS